MNELNRQHRLQGGSAANTKLMLAGLGVGGMLAYLVLRNRRGHKWSQGENQVEPVSDANVVDDRGTQQSEAVALLRNLRDRGFDGSDEKVALALGRTPDEIQAFNSGSEVIDDDLVMKARGIAMNRGISIE